MLSDITVFLVKRLALMTHYRQYIFTLLRRILERIVMQERHKNYKPMAAKKQHCLETVIVSQYLHCCLSIYILTLSMEWNV